MIVTAGATNKSAYFYVVGDASHASPGEPITGLLFSDIETGGSASYMRQGAARADLTLITLASASAAHADGGFILVDDTNMPGVYRCDYPDAAFATGVDQCVCQLVIASANNAVAAPLLVDITDVDLRDAVRAGLTSLPNAAADAAGGLVISDAGALDIDTLIAALQTDLDTITSAAFVTSIWAKVCETEGSRTAQQILSIVLSAVAGVTSAAGATLKSPEVAGSTRITATINGSNERTAITLSPSA